MEVQLIDCTDNAIEKLIYTKSTRLTQGEDTRNRIENMTAGETLKELVYISKTIPSSWEFVNYTFEITGVTRAFTHQFVRTRTGSYAQQTQRMLKMEKFGYTTPATILNNGKCLAAYNSVMKTIQDTYDGLIAEGIPAEDARGCLPTNIHTNIIAQFNLRTLAEMARSRTGGRTQGEYKEVFRLMCECVTLAHPWATMFLFPNYLTELQRLEDNIKKIKGGCKDADETEEEIMMDSLKIIDKFKKKGE